jgi:ParB-like nuclease domain
LQKNPNPVVAVHLLPIEKVEANNYNPNAVAPNEMKLLYISIREDGYTQPVVTIYDQERDKYVIIDGFHRYTIMRTNRDIYEANKGLLPAVVLEKNINQRMASTVRHNRARGKHSINGMSSMIMQMLHNGMSDKEVCLKLGLETEELLRLKHTTGFAKLFGDVTYSRAWETYRQREELRNARLRSEPKST